MDYIETINYLFQKLPVYQRTGNIAYKADIGNIIKACNLLRNPHKKFKSIHIAGTNGKGSTAHMISSILQEEGYKVGLYTSPHLKDFRERIKINGNMIKEEDVKNFVKNNKLDFEKIDLSFFEMTVAMAFYHFAKNEVDIAIIETGLGGRLDSTNIISPLISIITNISSDHTSLLGMKIEEIAKEKAGIIKKNTPVIIGRRQDICEEIFINTAKQLESEIIFCEVNQEYETDLLGEYQKENVTTAIKCIEILARYNFSISFKSLKHGLLRVVSNTSLAGRWHILNNHPLTICDIAHNEEGIRKIVEQIGNIKYQKLHFIIGMVNDKEINNILLHLPKDAEYYFCQADIPRSLPKEELYKRARCHDLHGTIHPSVEEAFLSAKKHAKYDDLIFVGGSTFVVSEII